MRRILFFSAFLLFFVSSPLLAKSSVQPLDKIIAVVNDDIITQLELDKRVKLIRQQLLQRGNRLPSENVLRRQILERLIIEKLQLELAKKTGVRVNDEMVNQVIANIARQNNLTIDQFRQLLQKEGFSFADYQENIRREIIISRLRKIRVENNINVSEQEIENFINQSKKNNSTDEEYHLGHILIALPEAASPEQISKTRAKAEKVFSDLKNGADFAQTAIAVSNDEQALKGGDLGWLKAAQLPSFLAETVSKMNKGEVRGPIRSASGFHIIKLIDRKSSEQKHIVKQTLARHILIKPNQVLSREEARMRLEQIRQRILNGEDFATLAKAASDDKASAVDGGSLGWVNPGTMVPAFEEQMNKLKPGEISKPFLTRFGWHIVQVLSRRKHDNTKEFQRIQAIKLIRKRKTREAIQDWLRRLRAEAYVDLRLNK